MPSPDNMHHDTRTADMLVRLTRDANAPRDPLVHEIQELRAEIADLRRALVPVPSLLITGQRVLAEFQALSESKGG